MHSEEERSERTGAPTVKLTPLRISIIYAVVGGLWILFSDNLLAFLLRDVPTLMKFSLLKGWLYVVVTAWMLYLLIRRYEIERRRREDFSRSQEQRYQNLVETERDVIYSLSTDGSITSLNPSFEKTTGFRSADLIGENFARLVHPDDLPLVNEAFRKVLRGETLPAFELRTLSKSGDYLVGEFMATPQMEEDRLVGMFGIARDITERKRAEEALHRSEERFRGLIETSSDWVWEVDGNCVYTYVSPKIRELLGCEPQEVLGKTPFDLMPRGEAQRVATLVGPLFSSQRPFSSMENVNLHKDGRVVVLETSGVPFFDSQGVFCGYRGIDRDITERKRLEEQLRQAQKMEAVGQLAGGIAHDFNNILTAIMGYGNLLRMKMADDEPLIPYVQQILASSERAADLTRSLLAFSRKQIINPKPVDVNAIIRKVEKLLVRLIGEDIEMRTVLAREDLTVMADSGQIEQVLMNLVTNARDVMPHGGLLTIATGLTALDEEFIKVHDCVKPGTHAVISVSDNGTGIDEETRDRIFDPFFTTKELGRGTGLGLSIVYGIVRQHEGHITAESEPGKGTTFNVYLPVIDSGVKEDNASKPEMLPGGSETVLLAEDDEAVRGLTKSVLEKFGYSVIEASHGEDAIKKFKEERDRIEVVILDVIMPKMNGKEVYEEIKRIQPRTKALFMSGYTADIVHKKGILEEKLKFIAKPVSPGDLLRKVREVLDA